MGPFKPFSSQFQRLPARRGSPRALLITTASIPSYLLSMRRLRNRLRLSSPGHNCSSIHYKCTRPAAGSARLAQSLRYVVNFRAWLTEPRSPLAVSARPPQAPRKQHLKPALNCAKHPQLTPIRPYRVRRARDQRGEGTRQGSVMKVIRGDFRQLPTREDRRLLRRTGLEGSVGERHRASAM